MIRQTLLCTFGMLCVLSVCASGGVIEVANASFEIPVLDPNEFPAVPIAYFWIEDDLDTEGSTNTGVFFNQPPDSPAGDHITNVDGNQLAFLNSASGNGFRQEMPDVYEVGRNYRLTVGVCPSTRFPPKTTIPVDTLTLAFTYPATDPNDSDIVTAQVQATDITANIMKDFFVSLPAVQATDPWAGQPIGIDLRASGTAGGYWDLDNVRLVEYPLFPELNGQGPVNMEDLSLLASEWMSCTEVETDLTGDGCVTFDDLAVFTGYWLENDQGS